MEGHTEQIVVGGQISTVFVDKVKQSVNNTFTSICQETPVCTGISENGVHSSTIVGIMSVVCKGMVMCLTLGFPKETALATAKKFTGTEIAFDTPDMGDVIGELANILTGDIAAAMEQLGMPGELSIPTVARGSEIEMLLPTRPPSVTLNFKSTFGSFWLKVALGSPNIQIKK